MICLYGVDMIHFFDSTPPFEKKENISRQTADLPWPKPGTRRQVTRASHHFPLPSRVRPDCFRAERLGRPADFRKGLLPRIGGERVQTPWWWFYQFHIVPQADQGLSFPIFRISDGDLHFDLSGNTCFSRAWETKSIIYQQRSTLGWYIVISFHFPQLQMQHSAAFPCGTRTRLERRVLREKFRHPRGPRNQKMLIQKGGAMDCWKINGGYLPWLGREYQLSKKAGRCSSVFQPANVWWCLRVS